ncbi:DegV family protein [Vallitalea okinawensis]|uniref:DegV family protein n=1 Tax=Vallitalea okinawensis TaxID=2078660 RepID=UPI000CFE0E36|nr:DegV family protein [Vallitalea okinawensis]
MRKIKLMADSSSDLSPEMIKKMNVEIIPLYVIFGDESYKDGVEINPHKLFQMVDERGALPKTSAITPEDFYKRFKKYTDDGYDILYISISSGFSSTCQNANIAAKDIENGCIRIIDSANLSSGIGLSICYAYDLIQEGYSIDEVVQETEAILPKVNTSFIIDTLEFLYKGGRCSAMQSVVSSMLNIRPIIKVIDGGMTVGSKIRGKKKKGFDVMIKEAIADKDKMIGDRVFITHSLGSEEEEKYIRQELEKNLPGMKIITTQASSLISCHCGKKTIGILYIAD